MNQLGLKRPAKFLHQSKRPPPRFPKEMKKAQSFLQQKRKPEKFSLQPAIVTPPIWVIQTPSHGIQLTIFQTQMPILVQKKKTTNAVVQHDDGANKDISSILEPDMDERKMLSRVVEKHVDDDIDGRSIETVDDVPAVPEPEIPGTSILSFKEAMERGFDKLTDKLAVMDSEIKRICVRVQGIEEYVADQLEKEAEKARYEDMRPGSAADFCATVLSAKGYLEQGLGDVSDESDEEDKKKKKKKQISKKKRKHVGPTLESGKKRGRKPSKYKGEEFTAEGKQTRKRQKN
ncbi:unnamed protein product [Arabidopsis thaliana]|uniref:(thale cress) hypothetical protein n=1 Tax=Arabidopsis thaliana TaxID=3702 RepID=A0A7G2FBX2_ARATH|nr:unnamed protein product [Arabidopsis thaliana]